MFINDPQEEITIRIPQDYKLYIFQGDKRTPETIISELTERLSNLFDITATKGGCDSHGTFIHIYGELIADYSGEYPDVESLEINIQSEIDWIIDNY